MDDAADRKPGLDDGSVDAARRGRRPASASASTSLIDRDRLDPLVQQADAVVGGVRQRQGAGAHEVVQQGTPLLLRVVVDAVAVREERQAVVDESEVGTEGVRRSADVPAEGTGADSAEDRPALPGIAAWPRRLRAGATGQADWRRCRRPPTRRRRPRGRRPVGGWAAGRGRGGRRRSQRRTGPSRSSTGTGGRRRSRSGPGTRGAAAAPTSRRASSTIATGLITPHRPVPTKPPLVARMRRGRGMAPLCRAGRSRGWWRWAAVASITARRLLAGRLTARRRAARVRRDDGRPLTHAPHDIRSAVPAGAARRGRSDAPARSRHDPGDPQLRRRPAAHARGAPGRAGRPGPARVGPRRPDHRGGPRLPEGPRRLREPPRPDGPLGRQPAHVHLHPFGADQGRRCCSTWSSRRPRCRGSRGSRRPVPSWRRTRSLRTLADIARHAGLGWRGVRLRRIGRQPLRPGRGARHGSARRRRAGPADVALRVVVSDQAHSSISNT